MFHAFSEHFGGFVPFKDIYNDREYVQKLTAIAIPLILQQMITYSVNLLDTMMIGSFGDETLAAVNLVNQFYMIFSMLVFGAVSGGNVLNAQFWGRKETENIHRVMGVQLILGAAVGIIFLTISQLYPSEILQFYSRDETVITHGATYLRIISAAFLIFPAGQFYSGALRSTGNARIPMIVSFVTLSINALLNYLLIFGRLGLPQLGLVGAGIATVCARTVETVLYITITMVKKLPPAARLRDMLSFSRPIALLLLKTGAPVVINESIWGLGTNAYAAIYAGISTPSIAAYSAVTPVDNIAQAVFIGVGDASAVIIGNLLGAGGIVKAKRYSKYTLILSFSAAVCTGLLLFGLRSPILSLFNLSSNAASLASALMTAVAFTLWLRTTNYTLIIGILRPGGQVLYCLFAEAFTMWCIGIPLARIFAGHFGLPIHWVYFGTVTEEFTKLVILWFRYRSGKWAKVIGLEKNPKTERI